MTSTLLTESGDVLSLESDGALLLEAQRASRLTLVDAIDVNGDLVDLLTAWTELSWTVEADQEGSGQATIDASDARARDTIRSTDMLRVSVDGARTAGIVLRDEDLSLGQNPMLTVSGPGPKGLLTEAVVYPPGGLNPPEGLEVKNRRLDWTEKRSDPSRLTGTVTSQGQVTSPTGSSVWDPAEFADLAPHWVWVDHTGTCPIGDVFLRRDFTTASDLDVVLEASADDEADVYVDGIEVVSIRGTFQWRETFAEGFSLPAGDHVLAIRARNLERPYGESPAGVVCSIMEANSDGSPNAEGSIVYTEASSGNWYGLAYPDRVPGMTTGEHINLLLDEAQARGAIQSVTTDVTDTADSDGNSWATDYALTVRIGQSVSHVLDLLIERGPAIWVTPDPTVKALPRRGSDKSATVHVVEGREVTEGGVTHRAQRVDGNVLLAETQSGGWSEHTHSSKDDPLIGRREAMLRAGSADTENGVADVVNAHQRNHALRIVTTTLDFRVSSRLAPLTDFWVGDDISVPAYDDTDPDGRMAAEVVSVSGSTSAEDTQVAWQAETQETQ